MKLITRAQWGARPRRSGSVTPFKPQGCAVHYEGAGWPWPWNHSTCAGKVRAIQDYHMDGRGWSDIAYNFLACPHDYVFEGRGLNRRSSANGNFDTNTNWYAVQCMWGTESGSVTTGLLTAARDAIDYCRGPGGAGNALCGHRDLKSTDCPGDQLYAWAHAGAPRPSVTPPPAPPEDDDMALTTAQAAELVASSKKTAELLEKMSGDLYLVQVRMDSLVNKQFPDLRATEAEAAADADRQADKVAGPD